MHLLGGKTEMPSNSSRHDPVPLAPAFAGTGWQRLLAARKARSPPVHDCVSLCFGAKIINK